MADERIMSDALNYVPVFEELGMDMDEARIVSAMFAVIDAEKRGECSFGPIEEIEVESLQSKLC